MGNVVKFEAQGKEYQLAIIDHKGASWIRAQQVGEALGNKNIRKLMADLNDCGEIKEGVHWCNVTLHRENDGKLSPHLILSHRGIIRVAVRSQGTRARQFRDWAEDVLHEVMTTGTYRPRANPPEQLTLAEHEAEAKGIRKGLALAHVAASEGMSLNMVVKLVKFRKSGLSQQEIARAYGLTLWKVKKIEKVLRVNGVTIPVVHKNKGDKQAIDDLENVILNPITALAVRGGTL